jgi:hypothetical protein
MLRSKSAWKKRLLRAKLNPRVDATRAAAIVARAGKTRPNYRHR